MRTSSRARKDTRTKTSSSDVAAKPSSDSNSDRTPKLRQRFGPDEYYLLVVQVNADEPYTTKHGDLRRQWDGIAGKPNVSPNYNMNPIKWTTAQSRFKCLLDVNRSWEETSASKSSTDEKETPFIQLMTKVLAKVIDVKVAHAQHAVESAGQQQCKELSGKVVRQTTVTRIKLGKPSSHLDDSMKRRKREPHVKPQEGSNQLDKQVKE
ncbi:hypothetical protein L914_06036 [Phytophthora nicotianae]|uniref:Uncharacterized protein n=3 Tax=Phytophthora nicotianae TaxID=4792 RepID=V9FGJ2_PHYNI|nr:hypothetical protein F443_06448 [Phytophthora nicotianae P1569]ETM49790.1 hypothetical protein L914_06036 [Phytophthora nicotianae]ETO78603.1 hypothetical protein F444_06510 [Phytophthora nicotianae P1976]